jgi:hypothetical protein
MNQDHLSFHLQDGRHPTPRDLRACNMNQNKNQSDVRV